MVLPSVEDSWLDSLRLKLALAEAKVKEHGPEPRVTMACAPQGESHDDIKER